MRLHDVGGVIAVDDDVKDPLIVRALHGSVNLLQVNPLVDVVPEASVGLLNIPRLLNCVRNFSRNMINTFLGFSFLSSPFSGGGPLKMNSSQMYLV